MEEVTHSPAGEELNEGVATVPRPASSVILLRGGDERLEVLLVQRTPKARFMGGVWVFPGGAVDAGETPEQAARRELREEADVELDDAAELVRFSQWITPAEVKVRFDTHFFLAALPDGAQPRVDGEECVDLRWVAPQEALDLHAAGELLLVFPTIKHFEQLRGFESAQALLDFARGREVVAILPRVVVGGETARVLLPGDDGYED